NLPADEIGGQCSKPTVISLRPAVFDRHVAAFDKTDVSQSLSNDGDQECIGRPRTAAQDTDNRKLLLRPRRQRPRRRAAAAEPRAERASIHSNTSSAALAVLRLMRSSYLVGCWTGSSTGLAPRRRLRLAFPNW